MKKLYCALKNNRHDISVGLYVLFSVFVRYICYGFEYYHQLDDYIQYFSYPRASDRWALVMQEGLLTARPLAGLGDLYFWGYFFENMIWAVLIISAMYALSAVLFMKVFKKHFNTGFMFCVFYALMPFFFEGAYWVSASSRIVVGLFVTSLAVWFLQAFFDTNKKRYLIPYWFFQLISVCLYEQISVLSVIMCLVVTALNIKTQADRKKIPVFILPVINALIYFGFTGIFSGISSALSSRMSLVFPSVSKWWLSFIQDWLTQMKTAFWDVPITITFKGFVRGLKIIVTDGLWLMIPVGIIIAVTSFILCKKEENYSKSEKSKKKLIICALILAVMPISFFLVIANPYFCMRNIVPSFVGIALILDMLFAMCAKKKKLLMQYVCAGISIVFFVSAISEMHDYKAVYDFDRKIAENVVQVMENTDYDGEMAFIIQSGDKGTVNVRYNEHGSGVISSNWALCGMLNYLNPKNDLSNYNAIPIETENNIYHYAWEKDIKIITRFEKIFYWNDTIGKFIPITLNPLSDSVTELLNEDGGCVATVKEHNNIGYILYN